MRQIRAVLVLALIAAYPAVSEASSIGIFFGGCSNLSASNLTGAPLSLSDSCTVGGVTTNLMAAGSLTTLRFYVDNNGPGGDPLIGGASVGAGVTITDYVTITGGTGSGIATFDWAIDGTLSATTNAYSVAIFSTTTTAGMYWQECGSTWSSYCASFPTVTGSPVSQTISVSFPFTYDVPFLTYFQLRGGTSGGVVDFFNTAALQPLFVTDSAGAQVTGVTATSDSGFQYAVAAPAAVPEPGSLVLFGTGIAAFATRIWRQRRRPSSAR